MTPVGAGHGDVDPTDWRAVGELAALVDPRTAPALLSAAGLPCEVAEADYLRLKVGESAVVRLRTVLREADGGTVRHLAYARTFADPDRAATLVAKWRGKKTTPVPFGPAIAATGRTVVHVFPNDGSLGVALGRLAEVGRWRNLLRTTGAFDGERVVQDRSSVDIVSYKPERRAVARAELTLRHERGGERTVRAHARLLPDTRGGALAELGRALADAGAPVARPIALGLQGRLVLEQTEAGVDGVDALLAGRFDAEAVAEALSALQRLDGRVAGRLAVDDPFALRSRTLDALGLLALVCPELSWPATRLALAVRRATPPAAAAVVRHGDLHLHQLLVAPDRVTLVDLERAGAGPAVADLAQLVAHLVELAGRRPDRAAAIERQRAELHRCWLHRFPGGDGGFGVHLAAALTERALLAFRTLDPDHEQLGAHLLEAATDAVGAARWHVVHVRPGGTWTARTMVGAAGVHAVLGDDGPEPVHPAEDPDLPGLRAYGHGALLAYRPGRRAVVRFGTGPFHKLVRPRRTAALVGRHETMTAVAGVFDVPRTPRVLAHDRRLGVVDLEPLDGSPLTETVQSRDGRVRRAGIVRAAATVARLRAVDVSHPVVRDLPVAGGGGSPAAWLGVITSVHPALGSAHQAVVEQLGEQLASLGATPMTGLVHGDLHDRNLLLTPDGDALIDLDGLALGEASTDSGNLAAHLFLRALQRGDDRAVGRAEVLLFLEHVPDPQRATVHLAATLHRLAVLYRFRAQSARHAPTLLAESGWWARGGG